MVSGRSTYAMGASVRTVKVLSCLALASLGIGIAQASDGRTGQTAEHLRDGKAAYAKWCVPCHAAEPGLAGTLALNTKYDGKMPAALEDRTDLTPETVEYFVRNGVAWMPSFRPTELSDTQVAAIGSYLSAPLAQRGAHAMLLADEMIAKRGGGR